MPPTQTTAARTCSAMRSAMRQGYHMTLAVESAAATPSLLEFSRKKLSLVAEGPVQQARHTVVPQPWPGGPGSLHLDLGRGEELWLLQHAPHRLRWRGRRRGHRIDRCLHLLRRHALSARTVDRLDIVLSVDPSTLAGRRIEDLEPLLLRIDEVQFPADGKIGDDRR